MAVQRNVTSSYLAIEAIWIYLDRLATGTRRGATKCYMERRRNDDEQKKPFQGC